MSQSQTAEAMAPKARSSSVPIKDLFSRILGNVSNKASAVTKTQKNPVITSPTPIVSSDVLSLLPTESKATATVSIPSATITNFVHTPTPIARQDVTHKQVTNPTRGPSNPAAVYTKSGNSKSQTFFTPTTTISIIGASILVISSLIFIILYRYIGKKKNINERHSLSDSEYSSEISKGFYENKPGSSFEQQNNRTFGSSSYISRSNSGFLSIIESSDAASSIPYSCKSDFLSEAKSQLSDDRIYSIGSRATGSSDINYSASSYSRV